MKKRMQCLKRDRTLAGNLWLLRRRSGLRQREVAAQLQVMGLDVSRETYSHIEAGIRHVPVPVLRGLKEIYRASWDEIMEPVAGGPMKKL